MRSLHRKSPSVRVAAGCVAGALLTGWGATGQLHRASPRTSGRSAIDRTVTLCSEIAPEGGAWELTGTLMPTFSRLRDNGDVWVVDGEAPGTHVTARWDGLTGNLSMLSRSGIGPGLGLRLNTPASAKFAAQQWGFRLRPLDGEDPDQWSLADCHKTGGNWDLTWRTKSHIILQVLDSATGTLIYMNVR